MSAHLVQVLNGLAIAVFTTAMGLAETGITTQQITVQLSPNAKLAVPSNLTLVAAGQTFLPFMGALPVTYRARSTPAGGGAITLQVSSDFAPGGGPSASAGVLTYTCSGATLGMGCSGLQTARVGAQTPVVAFPPASCTGGGGACSAPDPNSVQINLVLENNPEYSTGAYSAQLTLTISSI